MGELLRRGLTAQGFAADLAGRGDNAVWMAGTRPYDTIVVDAVPPRVDGADLCRRLRWAEVRTPVLMLTPADAGIDHAAPLDEVPDAHLRTPFAFAELLARVRELVRRGPGDRPAVLHAGGLRLDPALQAVSRDGEPIALSPTEYALLEALMRDAGSVLARDHLLRSVWAGHRSRSNVVDVYIRYLREKVDRPFGARSIETVRGAGYRLRADGGEHAVAVAG